MEEPKIGDYYIDKETGNNHRVGGVGKHTETEEVMVWHVESYGNRESRQWVTPLTRWCELIDLPDGQRVFRFMFHQSGNPTRG
jgi:hypothetical protein